MTAIVADVFRIALPSCQESNAVCGEETEERMANLSLAVLLLEEAVTAVTGVLDETVSLGHGANTMTEQSARVSNLFREAIARGEAVRIRGVNEQVTAANANVLVHAVAVGEAHIGVVAQETGQRVPNVGPGSVLSQILITATASACPSACVPEHLVVDHVSPQRAAEADQRAGWQG